MAPLGHNKYSGAMSSKGAKGGPWGHNLKLTVDILNFLMKSKNKGLRRF